MSAAREEAERRWPAPDNLSTKAALLASVKRDVFVTGAEWQKNQVESHGVALDKGRGIVCLCGEICNAVMGKSPVTGKSFEAVNAGTVFAQHLREARKTLTDAEIAKAKADALREFADFADDQDTAESARKYAEQVEEEAGI